MVVCDCSFQLLSVFIPLTASAAERGGGGEERRERKEKNPKDLFDTQHFWNVSASTKTFFPDFGE